MPREVFIAGQILTAAEMNTVSDQTVMSFANSAARGSAIPSPTEGMVTYIEDQNLVQVYDGSAWVRFGHAGIGSNVVQATTRTAFTTTSATFVDVTGLSVTITPSTSTSKVLVIAATNMTDDLSTAGWEGRIQGGNIPTDFFWKGRSLGENAGDFTSSMLLAAPMMYLDSPATTSAVTYKVQILGVSGATVYVNKARNIVTAGRSTLIAIEVAA